ncbi:hypothetical protein COU37_04315 [Candidatus Micrarchaeota archaeon CG10_big_fil_rev_8_21_14_0_10_45_29]|nr:MAG: hypothetical protein COU37_04315 [Candidatus Micrarchaeota archaeon CG10_big_fil_rev_8_21_14_0_10_45_29]
MARIVVPGEAVSEKPAKMAYTYSDGKKTYATIISMLTDENKLIPLQGPYEPLKDDIIVGYVNDVRFAGYSIALGAPNSAFLASRNTRSTFELGNIVMARIESVDEVGTIDISEAKVLENGRIERISPVKVPRLIGKKNSMISMIADASQCKIVVGRNGFIFITNDGDGALANEAIDIVEAQAHTPGLTDRMADFLSKKCGREIKPRPQENMMEMPRSPPQRREGGYGSRPPRREHGRRKY